MRAIKALLIITAVTMLTACEGKTLYLYRAKVTTINDKVCVLIDAKDNENLNLIEINSSDSAQNTFRKFYSMDDKAIPLSRNQCVPLFDYPFKEGLAYGVSIATFIKPVAKMDGRKFIATFTLYRVDGKLMATRI
ncbi:putative T6SS immunity periplasmic lipoprotein [Pantoea sp. FN0302]|uniref:putative T6SS immunity periplasmic lipoprotein n=1 Tax=unclassified Pantoea TaxID=2630326 RepID=UPI003CFA9E73